MKKIAPLLLLFLVACTSNKNLTPKPAEPDIKVEESKNNADLISRRKQACFKVYTSAISAIQNKNSGTPKTKLLAALPSRKQLQGYPPSYDTQQRLGLALLDIADQVYTYDDLNPQAYAAYSAEKCQRQLFNLPVPTSFTVAYSKLLSCNTLTEAKQRITCGMAVAGSKVNN